MKSTNKFWSGCTDFSLEVYEGETKTLVKLIICEVKNTRETRYASKGLEELLDYIHLVKKRKRDYLYEGPLCIGDLPFDKTINSGNVKVVSRNKNTGAIKW